MTGVGLSDGSEDDWIRMSVHLWARSGEGMFSLWGFSGRMFLGNPCMAVRC